MRGGDPRDRISFYLIHPRKIYDYLPDLSHADGGPKAAFFLGKGFERRRPEDLDFALQQHVRTGEWVETRVNGTGLRFAIVGGVMAPRNQVMHIRSVWAVASAEPTTAYLVTTYPL